MKFEDFKVGDYIIWNWDNDVGIITEIHPKEKYFRIHWYKSTIQPHTSLVSFIKNEKSTIILNKEHYFNKDMEKFLE